MSFTIYDQDEMLGVRGGTICLSSNRTKNLRAALKTRGLCARVARELGVSRSHLSLVARGVRSSRRIEAALERAINQTKNAA